MARPKVKDFQSEETHQVDYYEYFKAMSRYAEQIEQEKAALKARLKQAEEALDSILCLIGESEPDFVSPYQLREAIIKEVRKGTGKEVRP